MKFYVAGRYSDEPSRLLVQDMTKRLKELGHICTFEWANEPNIKPYENNPELSKKIAEKTFRAAREAELFIVVSHPEGTGMYVEYGAALAENLRTGKPKIYLIGEHKSCSLFNYHPNVIWKNSLEEILEDLK